MKNSEAVECRKCGRKHYMTSDGKGHVMPVFCCGDELKAVKKKTSSKTSGKALPKKNT